MVIAIYYRSEINYIDKNPAKHPLPGTETAVLRMSAALRAQGHSVIILTHPSQLKKSLGLDVLIVKRNPVIPILYHGISRLTFFWSPDLITEPSFLPLYSRKVRKQFLASIDKIIAISHFQATLYKKLGVPGRNIYVSRNGIDTNLYKTSLPKKSHHCIYVSTYCDGIQHLSDIWSRVTDRVPDATLTVICSRSLYGKGVPEIILRSMREVQALSGVTCVPPLSQTDLAKELLRSEVFLYPNTLSETSSITTLEARAAGCVIVTSDRGALKESAENNYLIKGAPSSTKYRKMFASSVLKVLTHYSSHGDMITTNLQSAVYYNWETIAREWIELFMLARNPKKT